MRKLICLFPVIALLAAPISAGAANMVADGPTLKVTGILQAGDGAAFSTKLAEATSAGQPIEAVSVDSPGGLIIEALAMANLIRTQHLVTVVPDHATCASACFMMFAAGEHRAVGQQVKIGVHSATLAVGSPYDDASGTLFMARYVAKLGVPAEVIAHLVETSNREVSWLSDEDLRGMGAVTLDSDGATDAAPLNTEVSVPLLQQEKPNRGFAEPSTDSFSTAKALLVRSHCHMNSCLWFSIESATEISNSASEKLIDLNIKTWGSDYPDGDYTKTRPREFTGQEHSFVICSLTRPTYIYGIDTVGWSRTVLAPGDLKTLYGLNETETSIYWAACHGQRVEDVYDAAAVAQKLGYPAAVKYSVAQKTTVKKSALEWFEDQQVNTAPAQTVNDGPLSMLGTRY